MGVAGGSQVAAVVLAVVAACGEDIGSNYRDVRVFGAFSTVDPQQAGFGDVDGDGDIDFVYVDGNDIEELVNDGNGRFTSTDLVAVFGGLHGHAVAMADITGDGRADVLVVNDNGGVALVLPPVGDGSAEGTLLPTMSLAGSVFAGDFVGDAHPDIVAIGGEMEILENSGGCPGPPVSTTCAFASDTIVRFNLPFAPSLAASGHFGGSHGGDFVVAADSFTQTGEVTTLLVMSDVDPDGFAPGPTVQLPGHVRALATGDLDGDGQSEIVLATPAGIEVWGLSGDTMSQRQTIATLDARAIATAHLASSDSVDLAVATNDSRIDTYVDDGGKLRADATIDTHGVLAQYVAAADLDGDGIDDLVVAGGDEARHGEGQLAVLLAK